MTATTATALSAYYRLARVHPQHVARIDAAAEALEVGTVARFEVAGSDGGSFYTGIRDGSRVVVTSRRAYGDHVSRSVRVSAPEEEQGAHLSVNGGHRLVALDPSVWGVEDTRAAKRAAETAASEALVEARSWRAKGSDAVALSWLDRSEEMANLAFALGILAGFITEPSRGTYADGRGGWH